MKHAAALMAASLALSTAAFAQEGVWLEIDRDDMNVEQFQMTVDELEDMDIYNTEGEAVGEVEEVLGTGNGEATAFAVEVGGFLDMGDTDVVIPFDQVTLEGDQLQVDVTKEEIEGMERWTD